jgi:hypothetical protein
MHMLSIRLRDLCLRWASTSLAHACTEHAHQEACPLLSYSASFLSMQHPILSCTTFYWTKLHSSELCTEPPWWATLRWATPPPPHNATYWTMLHPFWTTLHLFRNFTHLTEPQGTLLSYAAPNWVTLHHWTGLHPFELLYGAPCWGTRHTLWVSSPLL